MKRLILVAAAALAVAGCKSAYRWTSDVPQSMRTICVPTFRNESDTTELATLASVQLLREFQREGTFKIASHEDAAVEVQGVIKSSIAKSNGGYRRIQDRLFDNTATMIAEVSVVDRVNGRVLVDNKRYTATTSFTSGKDDFLTAQRSASGRLADDLARQVVDDVLAVQW
ncbi:MAG: hypothetical protein II946_01975 [Kiritimatiellae bacterium]|nr:hypothetical protein [Kiritimatiellia bacterium]